jgi:hypothetical protein
MRFSIAFVVAKNRRSRGIEARIASRNPLEEGDRYLGIPSRPRFGDLPDRRKRGMLGTRAAALSQVQQPAGQPPTASTVGYCRLLSTPTSADVEYRARSS